MTRIVPFLLLAGALSFSSLAGAEPGSGSGKAPLSAIEKVDLPRYLGVWYEIAKYPNRFQKKCIGYTTAEYKILGEGEVQVINRCRRASGEPEEAVGLARQVGPPTSPKFKVRFAPAWLSFIPAVWGDYWIIDLDEGYRLAAVSEPSREYLWILSRTPSVDQAAYDALRQRLAARGFEMEKLEITRQ